MGELQIEVAEVPAGITPTSAFDLGKGVQLPVNPQLFGTDVIASTPTPTAPPIQAPAKPKPVLAPPKPTARKPQKPSTDNRNVPPERTVPTFLAKFGRSAADQLKEIEQLDLVEKEMEAIRLREVKPAQSDNYLFGGISSLFALSQTIFENLLNAKKSEFGFTQLPNFTIGSSNGLRFEPGMFSAVKPTALPATLQDSYLSKVIPSFLDLSQAIFGNLINSKKSEFGLAQLPDFAIGSSNGLKFDASMFPAPATKPQAHRQSTGIKRGGIEVDPSSPLIWLQPNMEVVTEFPNWNTNTPLPPKKPAVAPAQITNTLLQTKKPVATTQQSVGRIQSFTVPTVPVNPDFLGLEGLLNNPFITGETEFKPNIDLTRPVPAPKPSPVAPKPPSKPAQATPGIKLPASVVPPPARATITPPVAVTRIEPTQQLPILNNSQDSQAAISQAEELRKATYQLLPEIVRVTDQATAQLGVQRQANQAASLEEARGKLIQLVQGFVEYKQKNDDESSRFGDFSRQTSGQIQDLLLPTIKSDSLVQTEKLIPPLKIGELNFSPNTLNDASREYNSQSNSAGENVLSLTRGIDTQIERYSGNKNLWLAAREQTIARIATIKNSTVKRAGDVNLVKEAEEFVKYIDGFIANNLDPALYDLKDKKANLPTEAKARIDTATPNINSSLQEFSNLNFDFLPKTQNDWTVKRERDTATQFAINQAKLMAGIRTLKDAQTKLSPDDSQETIDNLANLIKTLQAASADLPQQAKNAIAFQNISAGLKESSQTDVLKADRIERDQGFLGMFKVNTLRYNSQLSDLNQRRLTEEMSDERYTEELRKIRYETDALRIALDPVREQFSTFFSDLISGSKSLGESFADMARSIIGNLTQMVSQALASQAFNAIFGGLFQRANAPTPGLGSFNIGIPNQNSFASTGNEAFGLMSNIALGSAGLSQYAGIAEGAFGILNTVLPFATGGILQGGGFGGGIASSPTLALAGEGSFDEAIVPLPNGRSIPVELGDKIRNNISGTNNHNEVNISVNVSNNKADVVTSGQSNSLANQIRSAVIGVLIDEQRPGGALYAR